MLRLGVAAGTLYVVVILIASWGLLQSEILLLAVLCSGLTVVGYFFSPVGGEQWIVLANRAVSLLAIWAVVAVLVYGSRTPVGQTISGAFVRARYMDDPIPTFIYRREGNEFVLLEFNKAVTEFAGAEINSLIGKTASEMSDRRPDILDGLTRCWQTRAVVRQSKNVVLLTTGQTKTLEASYAYVAPDMVVVHVVDHTDRVRAEDALRTANQELEQRVGDRTAALEGLNESLRIEIAERRHIEQALKKSEESYRRLIEQSPEGILVHDGERNLFANNAALKILGAHRLQDVIDKPPTDFVHQEDLGSIRTQYEKMLHGSAVFAPIETKLRRIDGTEIDADRIAASIVWDGKPAIQVILRDITERKRAESILREAKENAERANASKSRFLAAASHDLRQPTQALNLFVHSLARKTEDNPEIQELVRNIRMSGEVMSGLLDALLDISKLDAGIVEPELDEFSVAVILDNLWMTFSGSVRDKPVELRVISSSARVRSDPALLESIVGNYISNAVRYTETGRILLGCRRHNGLLRIEVWDTGPGIAEDQQAQIYEEFYQLDNPARDRSRGLGLGLAIVERTARLLGHEIGLRSKPGRGSMFWVEVPLLVGRSPLIDPVTYADDFSDLPEGGNIVVIDDDEIVLEALRQMLSGAGFDVVAVPDAGSALAQVRATGSTPDLIVADHRLENAETGIRAIKRIQDDLGTQIPGIIVTGDTGPDRLREAKEGGHLLLHKPVRPDTLLQAVAESLMQRTGHLVS